MPCINLFFFLQMVNLGITNLYKKIQILFREICPEEKNQKK